MSDEQRQAGSGGTTPLRKRIRQWTINHLSIRQRLALWYASLLTLTLVLFSFIVYTIAQNQIQSNIYEEVKARANYIAGALQTASSPVTNPPTSTPAATTPTTTPRATATPTNPSATPTLSPGATPTGVTPTPQATVDPNTSKQITETVALKVPEAIKRLDGGFEVLDVRKQPKAYSQSLIQATNNTGLPLDEGVISRALQGTPGTYTVRTATSKTTSSLLLIYVQPIERPTQTGPVAVPSTTSGGRGAQASGPNTPVPAAAATGASNIIGVVLVAKPIDDVNSTLSTLSRLLIAGDLIAVLFASLGGWFIAESGLRPITSVTRAAHAIATSATTTGLGTRVKYSGPRDEVGELVATFNNMLNALERVSIAQRRFVADASHELRAPLTTIKGSLEFLRRARDLPADERVTMLEDAYAEAERMAALVNDLLLLARVDAAASGTYGLREGWLDDQLKGRREPVELDRLAMDIFRQGRAQLQARRKDLHLSVANLEPVTVQGDPGQLRQLALILLDNAIKYTPAGGKVRISVSRNGRRAAFSVADTGIGIAPEVRPHIFERFYRADQARDRDQHGSGLGLAIAKWIAESHGGEIAVHSVPSQGTTFTILLPAIRWAEGTPATSPREAAVRDGRQTVGSLARMARNAVSRPRRTRPNKGVSGTAGSGTHARPEHEQPSADATFKSSGATTKLPRGPQPGRMPFLRRTPPPERDR